MFTWTYPIFSAVMDTYSIRLYSEFRNSLKARLGMHPEKGAPFRKQSFIWRPWERSGWDMAACYRNPFLYDHVTSIKLPKLKSFSLLVPTFL